MGWKGERGNRMLETRIRINGQSRKKKKKRRKEEEKEEKFLERRERDAAKGLVEIEGGRRKRELSSGPTNPALPLSSTSAPEEKDSLNCAW